MKKTNRHDIMLGAMLASKTWLQFRVIRFSPNALARLLAHYRRTTLDSDHAARLK